MNAFEEKISKIKCLHKERPTLFKLHRTVFHNIINKSFSNYESPALFY